jgi:hypothetical protein
VVAAHPAGHHHRWHCRVFGDIDSPWFNYGLAFVSVLAFITFVALLASGEAHFSPNLSGPRISGLNPSGRT